MTKKIFATFLSVCLILAMIPCGIFAATEEGISLPGDPIPIDEPGHDPEDEVTLVSIESSKLDEFRFEEVHSNGYTWCKLNEKPDSVIVTLSDKTKVIGNFDSVAQILKDKYQIEMTVSSNQDSDNMTTAEKPVTYTLTAGEKTSTGTFSATSYIAGDLNVDGKCDANDAIYLLMHVNFFDTTGLYPVNQNVDYDKSETKTANDAIYLLMHVNFPDVYTITPEFDKTFHNPIQDPAPKGGDVVELPKIPI